MGDGDFSDAVSFQFEKRGKEPMHSLIQFHILETFSLVGFQGTSDVDNPLVAEHISHVVGHAARCTSHKGIVPFSTPSARDVIFVQLLDEPGDVTRVILHVGIKRNNDVAPYVLEAGSHGGGLSAIVPESYEMDLGIFIGKPAHDLARAVAAAVVNEHNFEFLPYIAFIPHVHGREDWYKVLLSHPSGIERLTPEDMVIDDRKKVVVVKIKTDVIDSKTKEILVTKRYMGRYPLVLDEKGEIKIRNLEFFWEILPEGALEIDDVFDRDRKK